MRRFDITVPATSANLGPGFDTLGLALDLCDTVHVELDESSDDVCLVEAVGLGETLHPRENLLCRAYASWEPADGATRPGARFRIDSRIPIGKGLGSSAASIVAGLTAAATALGVKDVPDEVLQRASVMEGHPDNAVAATIGGITVAFCEGSSVHAMHVVNHLSLGVALFVPRDPLRTVEARAVLPQSVSHADAVFNIARSSYLVTALIWGKWEAIGPAMGDRLHQPHRAHLIPEMDRVISAAREAGAYGAAMSGGGPSIIALGAIRDIERIADAMQDTARNRGWEGERLVTRIRELGATVKEVKDEPPA